MNPATPYLENISKIKDDIPKIAENYLKANSERILDLVRIGQLGKGRNSQDTPLVWRGGTGFYAKSTQAFADRENISKKKTVGQPYNFEWTGGTFNKMVMDLVSDNNIKIFTLDAKKALLESTYGTIFSLTEQHNTLINEWLLHHLYRYLFDNILKV